MKRNDIVILITTRHGISRNNPVHASEYACEGTITEVKDQAREGALNIYVSWDNGECNTYDETDLQLVNESMNYKSIW